MSPTTVYSRRSSRAEQRGGHVAGATGRCRGRTAPGPRPPTAALTPGLGGVHRQRGRERPVGVVGGRLGRAEHGHHGVADVLHDGAAARRGWRGSSRPGAVELPGQRRRVGVLGDGRVAADVGHQHGDLEALGLADAVALRAAGARPRRRAAGGSASRPAPRGRRWPRAAGAGARSAPSAPLDTPSARRRNSLSTSSARPRPASCGGRRRWP